MFHGMLLLEIIDRGVNHMRMRHKPWANDFLAENADIAISDPTSIKGGGTRSLAMTTRSILKSVREKGSSFLEW